MQAAVFQRRLLHWFDQHGRKNLPWQINPTPYRVWVSEIMLQQTQVATVIPYFERFMHHYPTVEHLAKSTLDDVLHLWAGLGYYSRARNLHRAAQLVFSEFHGIFPETNDALQSLPGIGESTAGAILSFAFHQPTPILDGNVKRVLARVHAITDPINDKKTEKTLWELARHYTPKKRVADYTQAIMDLGATLCTRSRPTCNTCPLSKQCKAHSLNIASTLPYKKSAKKIPTRHASFILLEKKGSFLLEKRPSSGIWGGLWSFPEIQDQPTSLAIRQFCKKKYHITIKDMQALPTFKHTFTHYHLLITPFRITIPTPTTRILETDTQIWYNPFQPDAIGLPKPTQTILQDLKNDATRAMRQTQKRSRRTRATALSN